MESSGQQEGFQKKKQAQPLGPEQPVDDSQAGVSYIDFEALEEPSSSLQPADLISLAVSEDWRHHYECLNLLRALNKHRRDQLLDFIASAVLGAGFIKEQIENLRSNLSKCALMFVKEVLMQGASQTQPDPRLAEFMRIALPATLIKTVFEKHFIALEAKKAVEQLVKGGANSLSEAIDVLVEGSKQIKNLPLAEQSVSCLLELVKRMPDGYLSAPSESLKGLVLQSVAECEGKRAKLKKASLSVLQEVRAKNGGELERVLLETGALAPERAAAVAKQVEEALQSDGKKVVDKSKDFRSFLKQQKTGGTSGGAGDQLL